MTEREGGGGGNAEFNDSADKCLESQVTFAGHLHNVMEKKYFDFQQPFSIGTVFSCIAIRAVREVVRMIRGHHQAAWCHPKHFLLEFACTGRKPALQQVLNASRVVAGHSI